MRFNNGNSHRHKCPKCQFVWRHSNEMFGVHAAHVCPCGEKVLDHYFGRLRTIFAGCCAPLARGTPRPAPPPPARFRLEAADFWSGWVKLRFDGKRLEGDDIKHLYDMGRKFERDKGEKFRIVERQGNGRYRTLSPRQIAVYCREQKENDHEQPRD